MVFFSGSAVHSAEVLRQTAAEFQRMHWWRLVFNAIGSAAVFAGFSRSMRSGHALIGRAETDGSVPSALSVLNTFSCQASLSAPG